MSRTESADTSHNITIPRETRDAEIRAVYEKMGIPPSASDMEEKTDYPRRRWRNYRRPWDSVLQAAGIPGRADWLGAAISKRLAERPEWQDYITFRSRDIGDECGLHARVVGNMLSEINAGERETSELDGVEIARVNNKTPVTWRADPVESGGGQ